MLILEVTIHCDDDDSHDEGFVTKWICIDNFTLRRADRDIIPNGEYLSDKHINVRISKVTSHVISYSYWI